MANFKDTRNNLNNIRAQHEGSRKQSFQLREALKKNRSQQAERQRRGDEASVKGLRRQELELQAQLGEVERQLGNLDQLEGEILQEFEPFADPRKMIGQFKDTYPIMLFPVRLETRFKRTVVRLRERHELWVRVFPDDCSIDNFEGTLSEAELRAARSYWISTWKAGESNDPGLQAEIRNRKLGAWRTLVATMPASRAYWVIGNYQPLNPKGVVKRTHASDIILVIVVDKAPDPMERKLLSLYWEGCYKAGDNAKAHQEFREKFYEVVGDKEKAETLLKTYVPVNFDERPADGQRPKNVQLSFLGLPDEQSVSTKLQSWSHAARITTFPDRFVLTGYQNGSEVFSQVGAAIPSPLVVGPSPEEDIDNRLRKAYEDGTIGNGARPYKELPEEAKAALYIEYLSKQSETRWLFDFDAAVRAGMGFRIPLTKEQYNRGFDRLFVLGVRLSADEQQSKEALETLLRNHQFSNTGLSILPQGTPTNNTEETRSAYSQTDDVTDTFERYVEQNFPADPTNSKERRDGRWLADYLGIDPAASGLNLLEHYYHDDQCAGRAMRAALWPATIGYWMESLMEPVFSDLQRRTVQDYYQNHVVPNNRLPALRIGDQPYGVLPISAISRQRWLSKGDVPFEGFGDRASVYFDITQVLKKVREDWSVFHKQVAHLGKGGDPHDNLLEVLGLHASSQEFYQRYANSLDHIYNTNYFIDPFFANLSLGIAYFGLLQAQVLLHTRFGYQYTSIDSQPDLFEKVFFASANLLKGPLIDDVPLSETDPLRIYTDDGQNYIQWLVQNANTDYQAIQSQTGFIDNKRPQAMLYQMLRHGLNLSFVETSLQLHRTAGLLQVQDLGKARIDASFIGFNSNKSQITSKLEYLERPEATITQNQGLRVADHITAQIRIKNPAPEYRAPLALLENLEKLQGLPTARLERHFAEQLDSCSYRLDAWLLGQVNMQLHSMRYMGDFGFEQQQPRPGIYLGAYGFVENLRPDPRSLSPVKLPEELDKIFNEKGDPPLTTDSTNAGYVHAPSVNHAVTAAVLRNAYLSNASSDNPDAFKINLSSERVRMALQIIEGMQQGQSLGALLGYQLERGLHDRHNEAEVDYYIYQLRKAFPLSAKRMNSTVDSEAADAPIDQLEARNVVDGLALIRHLEDTGNTSYPFGLTNIDNVDTAAQRTVINSEVERIRNINDAVADLAMAESVHQVVQGNYDRASGALDAFSKGGYPQFPDVVQTPRSGTGITQRVGIHFPLNATAPANANPRVLAEPGMNAWLEGLLPAAVDVAVQISYRLPNYDGTFGADQVQTYSMDQLGIQPLDLLFLIGKSDDNSMTALDDFVIDELYRSQVLRADAEITLQHTQLIPNKTTFFELKALIGHLRRLGLSSRPIRPSDMALPNEVATDQDASLVLNESRINQPLLQLRATLRPGFSGGNIPDLLADIPDTTESLSPADETLILENIDHLCDRFATIMRRLNLFGLPSTGFRMVYERRRTIYKSLVETLRTYQERWTAKQDHYQQWTGAEYLAAPDDAARLALLRKAEREVSTAPPLEQTGTVEQLRAAIAAQKLAPFTSRYNALTNLLSLPLTPNCSGLLAEARNWQASLPLADTIDLLALDLSGPMQEMVVLAGELRRQLVALEPNLNQRVTDIDALVAEFTSSIDPTKKVDFLQQAAKLLFGDDFRLVPSYRFTPEQAAELSSADGDRDQLLRYQEQDLGNDFPVDDWLYGLARVRAKLGDLEQSILLSEALRPELDLALRPFQLPYEPQDSWLALEYPAAKVIQRDRLLYTAYAPDFDANQPIGGLLIDEWTEVIPSKTETTGLTFHFDQPNNEAPQSFLLATPTDFRGEWTWPDLVDALHETLDLCRLRALEPVHIDTTGYAHLLPATISSVTYYPLTIALNYAVNNSFEILQQ